MHVRATKFGTSFVRWNRRPSAPFVRLSASAQLPSPPTSSRQIHLFHVPRSDEASRNAIRPPLAEASPNNSCPRPDSPRVHDSLWSSSPSAPVRTHSPSPLYPRQCPTYAAAPVRPPVHCPAASPTPQDRQLAPLRAAPRLQPPPLAPNIAAGRGSSARAAVHEQANEEATKVAYYGLLLRLASIFGAGSRLAGYTAVAEAAGGSTELISLGHPTIAECRFCSIPLSCMLYNNLSPVRSA